MKKVLFFTYSLFIFAPLCSMNPDDMTMHMATIIGNIGTMNKLLSSRPELIDSRLDTLEDTPLHNAVYTKQLEVAQFLLDRGAKINTKNKAQKTPLHLAVILDDLSTVQLLLDHKADINQADIEQITPLHYATRSMNPQLAHLLVKHGALVNAVDNKLRTPLHYAATSNNVGVAHLLLHHGAILNALDSDKKTPFQHAASCCHTKVLELFQDWPHYENSRKRQLLVFFWIESSLYKILTDDEYKHIANIVHTRWSGDTIEQVRTIADKERVRKLLSENEKSIRKKNNNDE